jgi:hypothetical protein
VAGRRFGAADEDVAGATGAAGANLFAVATAAAGAFGTASDVLCFVLVSCLLADFAAVTVKDSTFLVDDDVFFAALSTALAGVLEDFFTSLTGAEVDFLTVSALGLGFDVDDGLVLVVLVFVFGFEAGAAVAAWLFLTAEGVGILGSFHRKLERKNKKRTIEQF